MHKMLARGRPSADNELVSSIKKPAAGLASPSSLRSYLFALVAVSLWGSTAAVTKLLVGSLGNLEVLICSSLAATLTLLTICWRLGRLPLVKAYSAGDIALLGALGFLGVFSYRFLLQAAIAQMPAQSAFVINYTWPIMIMLFAAPLLGEKLDVYKLVAAALSFVGVVVIATDGNLLSIRVSAAGIAFALTASACYGLFSVLGKRHDYDRFVSTLLYYGFTFVFACVAHALTTLPVLGGSQIAGLAWLGVGPSALGFVCFSLALKHGNTAAMSNFALITPFVSIVYVAVLLHEPIAGASVTGLVLIVAGIVLQSILSRKAKRSGASVKAVRPVTAENHTGTPTVDTSRHYERLAPRFEANWAYNGTYVKRSSEVLARALGLRNGMKLADIGGGTALYGERLARLTGQDNPVFCVDPSAAMLEVASTKANVVPIQATARQLSSGATVDSTMPSRRDAILIRDAVHHFDEAEHTIEELVANRLVPGGRLVVAMLPTTLHLPLFRSARQRLECLQPEPDRIISAMREAGLEVTTETFNSALTFPRETYLRMVRERYLSVLSTFDDEELERGLAEMEAGLPADVAFIESFVIATGQKAEVTDGRKQAERASA